MRQLIIRVLFASLSYYQRDNLLRYIKQPTPDQLLSELHRD